MTSPARPALQNSVSMGLARQLADNADGFAGRAFEATDAPYDYGYGDGVRDVLRWLAGDEPTGYLRGALKP
jgi:hypothetical protein